MLGNLPSSLYLPIVRLQQKTDPIDPNNTRVPVPNKRFDFLCQYHKPASKIPAFLNVVGIADLVKGAHSGQGLGNALLSHVSGYNGIFHLTH